MLDLLKKCMRAYHLQKAFAITQFMIPHGALNFHPVYRWPSGVMSVYLGSINPRECSNLLISETKSVVYR